MSERGSSDGPGCLGLLLLIGFVGLAIAGIGNLFGGDKGEPTDTHRSPRAHVEGLVQKAAMRDVRRAALNPDEWIVYSHCSTRSRCTAELRYEGFPTASMAVDRYRIKGSGAIRIGLAKIETVLATDSITDCSGRYLGSGDPHELLECAS